MSDMRAKLVLYKVEQQHYATVNGTQPGEIACEILWFRAVSAQDYSKTGGLDENNTYAKYTPTANLGMYVANPALFGQFHEGDTFYVDFTKV